MIIDNNKQTMNIITNQSYVVTLEYHGLSILQNDIQFNNFMDSSKLIINKKIEYLQNRFFNDLNVSIPATQSIYIGPILDSIIQQIKFHK